MRFAVLGPHVRQPGCRSISSIVLKACCSLLVLVALVLAAGMMRAKSVGPANVSQLRRLYRPPMGPFCLLWLYSLYKRIKSGGVPVEAAPMKEPTHGHALNVLGPRDFLWPASVGPCLRGIWTLGPCFAAGL